VTAAVLSAFMFGGCWNDNGNNNPGGTGEIGLIGDWLLLEEEDVFYSFNDDTYSVNVNHYAQDGWKTFYTFTPQNEVILTSMVKTGNFWIEGSTLWDEWHWGSLYQTIVLPFVFEEFEDGEVEWAISGNTLTLTRISKISKSYNATDSVGEPIDCWNNAGTDMGGEPIDCEIAGTHTKRVTFSKANIAAFRRSAGKVYITDPALTWTEWESDGRRLEFGAVPVLYNDDYKYIDESDYVDIAYYTEGSKMFLLGLGCNQYRYNEYYDYNECVSYSIAKTVPLDYILSDGTLRLRPSGSNGDWDVWVSPYYMYNYDKMSKYRAKRSGRSKRPHPALSWNNLTFAPPPMYLY
jgi:hypothetical protein